MSPAYQPLNETRLDRIAEERALLQALIESDQWKNAPTQIIHRIYDRKEGRSLRKFQEVTMRFLKKFFKPRRDPLTGKCEWYSYAHAPGKVDADGWRLVTDRDLRRGWGLTIRHCGDFMDELVRIGIIWRKIKKVYAADGSIKTQRWIKLNVNLLAHYVLGNWAPGMGDVQDNAKSDETEKTVFQAEDVLEQSKTVENADACETSRLAKNDQYLVSTDITSSGESVEERCEEVSSVLPNSRHTSSGEDDSLIPKEPDFRTASQDPVQNELPGNICRVPLNKDLGEIVKMAKQAFPRDTVSPEVVRDLRYWLNSCLSEAYRLTPARFAYFVKKKADHQACTWNPAVDHFPRALQCSLAYVAKNWGYVHKELMRRLHGENLFEANWRLERMEKCAEDLRQAGEETVAEFRAFYRTHTLAEFLKRNAEYSRPAQAYPGLGRFLVSSQCGMSIRDIEDVARAWGHEFYSDLHARPEIYMLIEAAAPELLKLWLQFRPNNDPRINHHGYFNRYLEHHYFKAKCTQLAAELHGSDTRN